VVLSISLISIEGGLKINIKKKECIYCGEEEATEIIMNPNCDEKKAVWDVCKTCKDVIHHQIGLSFGSCMADNKDKHIREMGERICSEANDKLEEIAIKTKKPILTACVYKKKDGNYDVSSIEFTGEKQ
jgi:hypothetical protein